MVGDKASSREGLMVEMRVAVEHRHPGRAHGLDAEVRSVLRSDGSCGRPRSDFKVEAERKSSGPHRPYYVRSTATCQ
jgi:hypothetical protein